MFYALNNTLLILIGLKDNWEVTNIAYFCECFQAAFQLPEFDIEVGL